MQDGPYSLRRKERAAHRRLRARTCTVRLQFLPAAMTPGQGEANQRMIEPNAAIEPRRRAGESLKSIFDIAALGCLATRCRDATALCYAAANQ